MSRYMFRGWSTSKIDPRMIPWGELLNSNLKNIFIDPASCGLILMQSTGLVDIKGKVIYEGDIFEAAHDFGPAGFDKRIGIVEFDPTDGYQWEYWDLTTIKVIGNIYENEELLEDRTCK